LKILLDRIGGDETNPIPPSRRSALSHEGRKYTSDLTDEQWARLSPLLPMPAPGAGRPLALDMRAVVNAIFYILRTGCQWEELPSEYPNHNSVYYHYAKWRDDGTWQALN
jgi:putative transposase